MIRVPKVEKKVDAILCSDIHLRERDKRPVCRTDDHYATQWRKLDFIAGLQRKYNCPVLHGGDLFDHWKPSPELLSDASKHIPEQFFTIYGQHDLPQHNLELMYKSGLYNLHVNGKIGILYGCHFGESPEESNLYSISLNTKNEWKEISKIEEIEYKPNKDHNILVWHKYNYQGKEPWPGCTSPRAATLLRKYPQFRLIVTGDNHQSFVEEYEGRLLVNPGSMMRVDADQINFRPRVYLYHMESNTVTPVFIPIEEGAVTRAHLEKQAERDGRIDAFIESLNDNFTASVSFEENVERFKQESKIDNKTMEVVYKAMDK